MSNAILVAEPQLDARELLQRQLRSDGFEVVASADPAAANDAADLVLLGDADALERWQPECPVIVLGSPGADAVDRVRAFRRGCDDYVARPFEYEELLERVRAVLRRTGRRLRDRIDVGPITIEPATRRVLVDGRAVQLATKEYELLLKLASEPSRVFAKDDLLRDVWGFPSTCRTRTLDSHASRLRRKLAAAGAEGYVLNTWGVGYRLSDD
jgi:DNA-binding response OmpR family regulator